MRNLGTLKFGLKAFFVWVVGTLVDMVSSMGNKAGLEEGNAFARHEDGSFWPAHYLITNAVASVEIGLCSAVLYWVLRPVGRGWAKVGLAMPWLYFAYSHLDAATNNMLLKWPGLYVQTAADLYRTLFGGQ